MPSMFQEMALFFEPIFVARVLSPSLVLLPTLSLFFTSPQPPRATREITQVVVASTVPRRAAILSLLSLIALSYFLDGAAFIALAILDHDWPRHTGVPINTIAGVVAFSGLAALGSWKDIQGVQVWIMKRIRVAIAASVALDITLAVLLALSLRNEDPKHVYSVRNLVHVVFPAFRALLLLPLLATLTYPRTQYTSVATYQDVEQSEPTLASLLMPNAAGNQSTGLLLPNNGNGESSKYGTFHVNRSALQASAPVTRAGTPAPSTGPHTKGDSKPEITFEPTWAEVWSRLKKLTPYLWPKNSPRLQFLAFLCTLILVVGRLVNLLLPFTLGRLLGIMEGTVEGSPWPVLFAYVGLKFMQGSGGLSAIRDCLWTPVLQYSDREMSQLSFDHLLNLSFAWHTRRKTGEVLRVLDRGAAINHTFELILFNIIPTFVDIAIALAIFAIYFSWQLSLVLFIVMFSYVTTSVVLTRWRTRLRRQMNDRDVVARGIHTDCLLNYETVKYFGGEEHENDRYADALRQYQALEYKVIMSLNLLNLVQNFIITTGLLIGSLMVASEITKETGNAKFVVFITYLAQLYGPLNQLGYIYRSLNQSLVDTEKLLALLNEPTDVNDKENATELVVTDGEIEFDNVFFSYDGRTPALDGVSFKVPKGSAVALVGGSGSGKSTILRLLYRFYDLKEGQGRILIDGQDIRDVTQKSLRQAIGVVPQDSVLFNSSIGYNIGYGKFGSTPEEIEAAAKSAQMHDRITSFPDGYNTKVGERGVRLSGGEKQRVSIARTLLKNPPILLLDEATSALDTSTEKDIQKALQNLVQGRSSLSIAHRLSTIASSDVILVLKDGHVTEHGSFNELMEIENGQFAAMWADQVSSSDFGSRPNSVRKKASGYSIGTTPSVDDSGKAPDHEVPPEDFAPTQIVHDQEVSEAPQDEIPVTDEPEPIPSTDSHAAPSTKEDEREPEAEAKEPEAKEEEEAPSPTNILAFPSSDTPEPTSETASPVPIATSPGPSVTFGTTLNSPPERTGTPDPDADPSKRKRISSQNLQRFARRISLTTRRQGSSTSIIPGIPGFKRAESSPRVSTDDTRGEGSSTARDSTDTPADSLKGEDKKSKKKDKKSKKGSN
ncbi:hypothetical protein CPB83DRAFT_852990 [Crepidotus variabilis]|uniref:Mitochondrial half-size ABC transporter n=1 Tax=Crepidotus variabilis TaxID=179855 RepID=A0A9P6JQ64_9AGAR|nr:hypothetical protein CPB83DRAFT_852990 [Crepidotus variabilis]